MVLCARERGVTRVVVPEPQVGEAVMAGGVEVVGMRSLAQVVAELNGDEVPEAPPVAAMSGSRLLSWRGRERLDQVDLADLHGLTDARYAAEVSAAGGHHLLLSGPKGSGKTSLAERIPGPPARPHPGGGGRAHRAALAGRGPRAGRRADLPPALRRTSPRRQQGRPGRRWQRPRPARRDQPGALRRALPRRVPAVPHRRHRRAARADGERRHHHRPAPTSSPSCRPAASWCSLRTHVLAATTTRTPRPAGARAASRSARTTSRRVRGPITDRIDITRHLQPLTARGP